MKQFLIAATALFLFTTPHSYGQELVYEFEPDSAIYELGSTFWSSIIPSPEDLITKSGLNVYYFFCFAQKKQ